MPQSNEATIRSDFAAYTDPDGLLQLILSPPPCQSGNGILFTGHKIVIFNQQAIVNASDTQAFEAALGTCQVVPGLYNRCPSNTEQEGPDDYVGMTSGSLACGSNLASAVLSYGKSQVFTVKELLAAQYPTNMPTWATIVSALLGQVRLTYFWNNANPGQPSFSSWLGRQPAFVAHIHWAAGQSPSFWTRFVWWFCMIFLNQWSDTGATTNKILAWHYIQVGQSQGGLIEKAIARYWYSCLAKAYPNGMTDVMTIYFGSQHPVAKWVAPGNVPDRPIVSGPAPLT